MLKNLFLSCFVLLFILSCQIQGNNPTNPDKNATVNIVDNLKSISGFEVPPEQGSFFKYISDTETGINGDLDNSSCIRALGVDTAIYKNRLYAMFVNDKVDSKNQRLRHVYVRKQICNDQWQDADISNPILNKNNINTPYQGYYQIPYRLIVFKDFLYAIWGEYPGDKQMMIRVSRYSEEKGSWESVDGGLYYGISSGNQAYFYHSGAYVLNNELYIAWYQSDSGNVVIKKYDGNNGYKWESIPNGFILNPENKTFHQYFLLTLQEYNGKLCMAYINSGNNGEDRFLQTSLYDTTTKKWASIVNESLNDFGTCASDIHLYNFNQKLYIAYRESTYNQNMSPVYNSSPYKIKVKLYEYGNKWTYVGNNPIVSLCGYMPVLMDLNGVLHLLCVEDADFKLVLRKFNQPSWDIVAIMSNKVDCEKYVSEIAICSKDNNIYPMSAVSDGKSVYLLWQRFMTANTTGMTATGNKYIFAAKGSYCN